MKHLPSSVAKGALGLLLLSKQCCASSKRLQQRRRGLEGKANKVTFVPNNDVLDFLPPIPKNTDTLDAVEVSNTISVNSPGHLRIDTNELFELATTYEGGWVQDGVMFDVRVNNNNNSGVSNDQGIVVLGLDILTPAAYETVCVEIYSRDGTYQGFDTVPSAWEFLGSVSIMGLGKDTPTTIPLGSFDPVYIAPDSTRAFYITTQNESLRYTAYTNGEQTTGNVFSAAGDGTNVEILMGVAKNYPFAQSWSDRMFNGALYYMVGSNTDAATILDENQVAQAQYAKRGKFTCDVDAVVTEAPTTGPPATSTPVVAPLVTTLPTLPPVGAPTDPPVAAVITAQPSGALTKSPTKQPTDTPTEQPTDAPTEQPTDAPTTLEFTMKTVATTLHGGLKQAGMMFDIHVPSVEEGGPEEGLTILSFEVSTFMTDEICVEVYSKEGTHVQYESDATLADNGSLASPTWNILGAATTKGMGETTPTDLPVGSIDPTFIGPGETRAYYVTMTVPEMRYTEPLFNEKTGDVFVESTMGHLQILVGTAISYPFLDSWKDRIYNGAVVYAIGKVEDGKYSIVTADARSKACPRPSGAPTGSPSLVAGFAETESPVAEVTSTQPPVAQDTSTQSPAAQVVSTQSPVSVTGQAITETNDDDVSTTSSTQAAFSTTSTPGASFSDSSRLDDTCPSAGPKDKTESKEVVIEYRYAMVTNSSDDFKASVTGVENLMHTELMESKCSGISGPRARVMQESIQYYGFNSNPADEIVAGEECSGATLAPYEECTVVQGGFTAYVPDTADESTVKDDLGQFANSVLSDTENHDALGVNKVIVESDGTSSTTVDSAVAEAQAPGDGNANDSTSGVLSTTAIIILAAVAGCVALALILLFIKGRNKKTRRANANEELFHEFHEEPAEIGDEYSDVVYNKNAGTKAPSPSLFPRGDEESTYGKAPVILNEQDDLTLVSNDMSKARFAVQHIPPSPGSDASRSSKGSVKFVRAGESFTSRSHQPEDTVDL